MTGISDSYSYYDTLGLYLPVVDVKEEHGKL